MPASWQELAGRIHAAGLTGVLKCLRRKLLAKIRYKYIVTSELLGSQFVHRPVF
jgi:hypothetical protein